MYAFAKRPKWIVSHVLVLILIVTMTGMGLWQIQRHNDRQEANAEVVDRLSEPVVALDTLTGPEDPFRIGEDLRWRIATVTGVYQPDDEVLVLGRTYNNAAGYWALTPLLTSDGSAVAINRGWVPFSPGPGEPRPESAAPTGEVTVQGLIRETVTPEGLQSADPTEGTLDALARADLERFEAQLDYDLYPVFIQLEQQAPPVGELPIPVPRPDQDSGPHLSYAFQWAVFTLTAIIGYPLVLRRVARSEGSGGRHSDIPVDYL